MREMEYITVEVARERLGISYKEMSLLLESGALHGRKDDRDGTARWVRAEDVEDAEIHLARYRQEERERIRRLTTTLEPAIEREDSDTFYFTFSDTDLMTLLLAAVSYFDAERDIYFGAFDERADIGKNLRAITTLYSRLESESKAGRPVSEIIAEIYERRPEHKSRYEVFRYLMEKTRRDRDQG
jgi:hypothetical protein